MVVCYLHRRYLYGHCFSVFKSSQQNILIRGETSYNSTLNDSKLVVKKGVKIGSITLPDEIPMGVTLKAAKIDDVKKLYRNTLAKPGMQRRNVLFIKM